MKKLNYIIERRIGELEREYDHNLAYYDEYENEYYHNRIRELYSAINELKNVLREYNEESEDHERE